MRLIGPLFSGSLSQSEASASGSEEDAFQVERLVITGEKPKDIEAHVRQVGGDSVSVGVSSFSLPHHLRDSELVRNALVWCRR